jgi:hypothetical protein
MPSMRTMAYQRPIAALFSRPHRSPDHNLKFRTSPAFVALRRRTIVPVKDERAKNFEGLRTRRLLRPNAPHSRLRWSRTRRAGARKTRAKDASQRKISPNARYQNTIRSRTARSPHQHMFIARNAPSPLLLAQGCSGNEIDCWRWVALQPRHDHVTMCGRRSQDKRKFVNACAPFPSLNGRCTNLSIQCSNELLPIHAPSC